MDLGCDAFVLDLERSAPIPTCFVEGISVGVAGRLLGRFCWVHTGIRFTIQWQRKTGIKPTARERSSRLYSSHVLRLARSPSITRCGLLSFCRPLGLFGVQGRLRFSLLFPVQPPSLLLSARVSLPPSLSPYVPSLPLSLQFSSLTFINGFVCAFKWLKLTRRDL